MINSNTEAPLKFWQAVPGIFVQKTNHGGGSPFIRGLTGNQILLMIDGIRVNNSTFRYGPNQYLNTIDVYSLSRVEVVRGSGSVQYGSDAMGGVIQVFTKDPLFLEKKKISTLVNLKSVSQNMEYTGHGDLIYESKKMALLVGVTMREFGDLIGGDTTGKQTPSGYKEHSFNTKLKLKLTNNSVLTLAYQFLEQKDVPLYHKVILENYAYYTFNPQQRQMGYAKLERRGKNKLIDKISFITSLQQSLEQRNYKKNNSDASFEDEDKVNTIGLTADIFSQFSNLFTTNTGIEYYHDKVFSKKTKYSDLTKTNTSLRGLYPDNSTNGNFSVYTLQHLKIKQFTIESGLRFNSYSIQITDTSGSLSQPKELNIKPTSLVGNLAINYRITPNQSIYSSFSTCYRMPNIDDMGTLGLVDFRFEIPAYNIKPEKTYNTEIGYRISSKKLEVTTAFFYMHLADLVTRMQLAGQQVGGYNVYTKVNSQASYIKGIEGSFNYIINSSFQIKSNASCTYGQNLSKNEPMRRIPPLNGRLLLSYNKKRLELSIEDMFAGMQNRLSTDDKSDNRIAKGGTPGWNVLNFYANYSFKKICLYTGIQNILNKDYRTHGSGINGVGRSIFLSIQFKL